MTTTVESLSEPPTEDRTAPLRLHSHVLRMGDATLEQLVELTGYTPERIRKMAVGLVKDGILTPIRGGWRVVGAATSSASVRLLPSTTPMLPEPASAVVKPAEPRRGRRPQVDPPSLRERVRALVEEEPGLTAGEMSKRLGVSRNMVLQACKRAGLHAVTETRRGKPPFNRFHRWFLSPPSPADDLSRAAPPVSGGDPEPAAALDDDGLVVVPDELRDLHEDAPTVALTPGDLSIELSATLGQANDDLEEARQRIADLEALLLVVHASLSRLGTPGFDGDLRLRLGWHECDVAHLSAR